MAGATFEPRVVVARMRTPAAVVASWSVIGGGGEWGELLGGVRGDVAGDGEGGNWQSLNHASRSGCCGIGAGAIGSSDLDTDGAANIGNDLSVGAGGSPGNIDRICSSSIAPDPLVGECRTPCPCAGVGGKRLVDLRCASNVRGYGIGWDVRTAVFKRTDVPTGERWPHSPIVVKLDVARVEGFVIGICGVWSGSKAVVSCARIVRKGIIAIGRIGVGGCGSGVSARSGESVDRCD